MFWLGRQLRAILWKNVLLKRAHVWSTLAEILLPVMFMAILILIKQITTVYDSPNVAYYCGNTFPWHYNSTISTLDGGVPYDCLKKPDVCDASNYYRGGFTVETPNGQLKGYDQLGYIDSGASLGQSSNPFYAYTVADESQVYSEVGVDNPSLPISQIMERLQLNNVLLALAPKNDDDTVYAEVQKISDYILQEAGNQYADSIMLFESQNDLEDYITDRDYDDEGYKNGKVALALVLYSFDAPNYQWDYAIRANYTYNWETNQESVACLYGNPDDCEFTYTIPSTQFYTQDLVKPQDSSYLYGYTYSGFATLQLLMDNYIMSSYGYDVKIMASLGLMPTFDYLSDDFQYVISSTLGIFYMLSFLYPVSRIIRGLVVEKEDRIKEGMKMMGLTNFSYNLSWFITILTQLLIVSLLITLVTSTTVFEYSDKFLVFIYFAAFSFAIMNFCFLMATFFSRAKVASLIGPMVFFGSFFPYYAVSDPSYSTDVKASTCLLAPACFALGANVFADFEGGLVGVQWTNSSQETNNFSYSLCVGMLIVDAVLYGLLAWYFDKIIPSEFGTHLPPWFLVSPAYWCNKKISIGVGNKSDPLISESQVASDKVERISPDLQALASDGRCVSIRGLRKVFQTTDNEERVAVKSLTMDIFEGQCTVLLGHNGAGKSTAMGMLTGLLPPSAGDAKIRGLSINDNMQEIRTGLGVCPQHDILFPELTVKQHLEMFAVFKGVPSSEVAAAADRMIAEVGLKEKTNIRSSTLSGGQKRKLSVGIALIGDSKVVILDEPTSGMDPFSRRSTWNIIQRNKKNRVILLTTHFMDEADILGDRIAIMAHGELRCFGSSLFLKRMYGVGYTFTIEKTALVAGGASSITDVVKKHVRDAEILSNVGAEQSFRLPFQAAPNFVNLFREIETRKEELKIGEFGISVTTLEEVFIRVGKNEEDVHEREIDVALRKSRGSSSAPEVIPVKSSGELRVGGAASKEDLDFGTLETDEGMVTFVKHFKALFLKRFIYGKRDKRMVLCQLVLPVLLVVLGLGLLLLEPGFDQPELVLSPTKYNEGFSKSKKNFVPFSTLDGNLGQEMFDRFNGNTDDGVFGVAVPITHASDEFSGCANGPTELFNISNFLIHENEPDSEDGSSRYGAVTVAKESTVTDLSYNVLVNGSACHGVGIYMNLLHTAFLQVVSGVGSAAIKVRNYPLPRTWSQNNNAATADAFTAALFVMIAFCFVPASYATFIVKEREVKAKHQQIISGVSIYAYWTSSWVWDFLSYLPTVGFVMILCAAYDIDAFTKNEGAPAAFLLFLLFGPAVASFTYMITFLFKSHSTAQLLVMFLNFLTGLCLMIVSFVLTVIPSTAAYNIPLRYVYRLFPSFCLGDGLTQLALCDNGQDCPSIDKDGYNYDNLVSPLSWDITGGNITFLAIEAVVYFAIAVFIEWSLTFPKIVSVLHQVDDSGYDPVAVKNDPLEDADVRAERQRVAAGGADGDVVKINELRKVYATPNGNKVAVRSLSFGIPKGECFGFLGINGAGKTTTLSILSGEFPPTSGEAFIDGFDISEDQSKIRKKIGYCPQFDALLELLTVREHLELFARIKGIPAGSMEAVVRGKLEQLDLVNFENKAAGSLSGGNKRKLSVAIALIGEPSIVFLDEPSTGMDPMARRHMWEVISRISTQDAKCSIILTTHSMEEAEALCTRIGIMVNGRLRCLGSSQHLKLTFGNGYEIDMKTCSATVSQIMGIAQSLQNAKVVRLQNDVGPSDTSPMLEREHVDADESQQEDILSNTLITMADIKSICSALMESERYQLFTPTGEGSSILSAVEADGHINLKHFLEWWIAEDCACKIADFMREEFDGSVLLERSTSHSFRYRIPSSDIHLADVFDKFEKNKILLQLEDYSVGQTTLEQIFNQFASSQDNPEMEQEHLQQLALRVKKDKASTNSSKSSFGVDGKQMPMKAPVTQSAPFKRTSTNTSFSKSASLTGGAF